MPFDHAKSLHRKIFAQNFLNDPGIARDLIRHTGITKTDTVVEIGPGEGAITRELAAVAGRVIAIEKDARLVEKLSAKFATHGNVIIVHADFLVYSLKEKTYKIFANIPFNITNRVVKKLLSAATPPDDTWLFIQKEAAGRLCGLPKDQELSILTKPWFTYDIVHQFNPNDFTPVPSVDVVLIHIHKREQELLESLLRRDYGNFVTYGYRQQRKDLGTNFKNIFTYEQWKRLAKDLRFPARAATTDLTAEQWVGLFRYFQKGVSTEKKLMIGRS